jgi:glutamyl-tRNA reductase
LPCSPVDHGAAGENNDQTCHPPRDGCAFSRFDSYTVSMKDFNRKVEDASARVNKSVAGAAERMEKETAEFIAYLNDEVVPAVRQHSTKALRVAARKMSKLADYLDEIKSDRR